MKVTIYSRKRDLLLAIREVLNLTHVPKVALPISEAEIKLGEYYEISYRDEAGLAKRDIYYKLDRSMKLNRCEKIVFSSSSASIIDDQRKSIDMYRSYVNGMTYHAIARQYHINTATVMKKITLLTVRMSNHVPELASPGEFKEAIGEGTSECLRLNKDFWMLTLDKLEESLAISEAVTPVSHILKEDSSVYGLILSTRARNVLACARVNTIKDLISLMKDEETVRKLPRCGKRTYGEYQHQLHVNGFVDRI